MSLMPAGFKVALFFDPVGDPTTSVDITSYVRSGSITRGSSRYDGNIPARYEAGTCTLALSNADARFDPTNLSGPYVSGGVTQLLPDKPQVKVTATGPYALFTGNVDAWTCTYPSTEKDAVCTLTASDGTKVLNTLETLTPPGPQGAHDQAGTRISRILDWYGGFGSRDIRSNGAQNLMFALTLSGSAWSQLQDTADAELGEIYFRGDGTFVFRDRAQVYGETRAVTSNATFGDAGAELRYTGFSLQSDDLQLRNQITMTSGDAVPVTVTSVDSASVTAFGPRNLAKTLIFEDGAGFAGSVTQYMADFARSLLSGADVRVDSIVVNPFFDTTNLYPQALGREMGDRITVKARPPGRAANPISRDCWIRGIAHDFGPASWLTTFALQDCSRAGVMVFDNATVGTFDAGKFSF